MKQIRILLVLMLFFSAMPVNAEKVNLTHERLHQTATHVITGTVKNIYSKTETTTNWKLTKYIAEIKISECQKGNDIEKGALIYVRYWSRIWIGDAPCPTSTTGHRGLPGEGMFVRVYLAQNAYDGFDLNNNDGGFNVIGANGFETLQQ